MLISDLIAKLQKLHSEAGDLPVFFVTSSDYTYSVSSAYITHVDTQMALDHSDRLEVNQSVAILY